MTLHAHNISNFERVHVHLVQKCWHESHQFNPLVIVLEIHIASKKVQDVSHVLQRGRKVCQNAELYVYEYFLVVSEIHMASKEVHDVWHGLACKGRNFC